MHTLVGMKTLATSVRPVSGQLPSPNNIKLFILAPEDEGHVLSGRDYVRLPYEIQCFEDVCAEVSTAIYLRADQLSNTATVVRALEEGAGYTTLSRQPNGHPAERK